MKKFTGHKNSILYLVVISVFLMTAPVASFAGGLVIKGDNVGIGTTSPSNPLDVQTSTDLVDAISGVASTGIGVAGYSTSNTGVYGAGDSIGVWGTSNSGTGVYGHSGSGYAGYFDGSVYASSALLGSLAVTGGISATSIGLSGSVNAASYIGDGSTLTNVGSSALAAGSVTSSKIAYYSDVAIVAPSGGNFNNPYTAMSAITSWCNPPSGPDSSHPCLVKIMPGIYNIGTYSVAMQPYCDIEGSGQHVTVIEGNVDSLTDGVIKGAQSAEIRFIGVRNTGDAGGGINSNAVAISNNFAAAPPPMQLVKVLARASGASGYNIGIRNIGGANPRMYLVRSMASGGSDAVAVLNENATPNMEHVFATGSAGTTNYGVLNNSASPTMVNVTARGSGGSASYGVYTDTVSGLGSSSVTIRGSDMTGATNSVYTADTQSASSVTYIGGTQLNGTTGIASGGSNICAGVYDTSFAFYASICP